jgi:signal peptidase I
VFRTSSVPGLANTSERDKYYVKRLVGEGGDTLQVHFPALYRNGKPIEGADAFEFNARQVGDYEGYLPSVEGARNAAPLDEPFTLPPDTYFAMGDNSDESSDSRVWGIVPEDAVIGRPLFIYWPFAQHFGPAR